MLILLALPVIGTVTAAHRYLHSYAPTNLLARGVRAHRPRLSTVVMLWALAGILLVAMKALSDAVSTGAPGWLNFVVLILAWDSIKIGWLAMATLIRWFCLSARGPVGHGAGHVHSVSYS